jgi:hypothetical protein
MSVVKGFKARSSSLAPLSFREGSAAHVFGIFRHGLPDRLSQSRVHLDERGHERVEQPEKVITDKDLTVTIRPRAYANRRNTELHSKSVGHFSWNRLKYQRESPRILECERIVEQSLYRVVIACLLAHPTEAVNMLRR